MPSRILLTGIPGPSIFRAQTFTDFAVTYAERRKDIRNSRDLVEELQKCGNTGNLLIGEGADAALAPWNPTYLPFWQLQAVVQSPKRIAALRERFDIVVLATANMIRPGYSADSEADVLTKLGMRTLVMGMGMGTHDPKALESVPDGTLRLLRFLAEGGHTVFTRGAQTRDYIRGRGVENAVATGCPSIYLRPERMKEALQRLHGAGSVRSGFGRTMLGGYLGLMKQGERDIAMVSNWRRAFRARSPISYVMQDEFLHYGLQFDDEGQRSYDPRTGRIHARWSHPKMTGETENATLHVFLENDDWRAWAFEHDFYFGRRFHGGVLAMQAGVPSLFVAHDDRMREMLSHTGFPHLDARELDGAMRPSHLIASKIEAFDADAAVRHYEKLETEFREVLTRVLESEDGQRQSA